MMRPGRIHSHDAKEVVTLRRGPSSCPPPSSLRAMMDQGQHVDVTLVCQGGACVEAHQAVMAKASNILKELFQR